MALRLLSFHISVLWLKPGVEVVSRDRASSYAEGAKKSAPNAIQIADPYHLVANLRDALHHLLDRQRQYLPERHEYQGLLSPMQEEQQKDAHRDSGERSGVTQAEALRQTRRSKRYKRYQAVMALSQQGIGLRTIARQTGLARNTVRRYLQTDSFPEQGLRRKRRSLLDPYLSYLRERWDADCQNAAQLYREVQDRGELAPIS